MTKSPVFKVVATAAPKDALATYPSVDSAIWLCKWLAAQAPGQGFNVVKEAA